MSKKYTVIIAGLLGAAVSAQADWETALNAAVGINSGNAENSAYSAGLEGKNTNDTTQIYWNLGGTFAESEINGVDETTEEKAEAGATYRTTLNDPLYAYVDGSLLYDELANVNYRGIVGPGVGTKIPAGANADAGIEIGAALIFEELENTVSSINDAGDAVSTVTDLSDENIALRIGHFYTRKLSDTANYWHNVEYLPLFDDFDDYLLNAEAGIESAVSENLSLRIVVGEKYDATPAAGKDESDFTLTGGLSYKL